MDIPQKVKTIGYMPWHFNGNAGYYLAEDGNVWSYQNSTVSNCGEYDEFMRQVEAGKWRIQLVEES